MLVSDERPLHTTAKEAGAAALLLLEKGITGVTVSGIKGKKIQYIPTQEAIKQRHVDLNSVAIYEQLGICFGREKSDIIPEFEKMTGTIERYL